MYGERRREAGVEGDKVRPQLFATRRLEAVGQRLGRPVAGGERVPRRFGAGLAIVRDRTLELQLERLTEELLDSVDAAPFERRRRCR